jgi:hypothetical protein
MNQTPACIRRKHTTEAMFIKFNVAVAGVLTAAAFMISAATGEEQQVSGRQQAPPLVSATADT